MMPALPEPEPELDMQAVGWAIANSQDYDVPLIQEWFQLELEGFPLHLEQAPPNLAWDVEWIAQHEQLALNPLDGISLYMLFQEPQPQIPEEDYFWDPEPVWHFPVTFPGPLQGYTTSEYMTHFVENDLVQEETRVLGECFFPSTINRLVDSVPLPAYDPVLNIIDEDQPRPVVSPPEDFSVMVTDLIPPANLWDVGEIVDVQPANLQARTSSNPSNQRNEPIAFPGSAPLELPSTDLIRRQLERVPAVISLWGLICSSREHRQKLCPTLARLEVQSDVTHEAMISLILLPTAKHTGVFTDKDLPVEGTDHNRPLHIIVKCRGLWVPTVLIDNGSAINVCPIRVVYRLGLAKKDFAPSNLAVKA
ncbi:hypothetical protein RHMOL_Rhmol06G0187900 [Rhododendron molle]|uniref:Uncharacterized protein n=1 Tax=Rhododendron molle TaxID=49168 RepID=A0ACC0NFF4_RHOML|nr:hypothetical protein RHMOL_Rhmol06G0187900 [Rhododendron molle]